MSSNWRQSLKKLALLEVPLTEEMIDNGARNIPSAPTKALKVGDTLIAASDIYGNYQGKSQLIFRGGNEYQVVGFLTFPSSSFNWVSVTTALGVNWAISFDTQYGGGAENFSKLVESKEEEEERFLASPKARPFVDSILLTLYKHNSGGTSFASVPLKSVLEDASSMVLQSFTQMPSEKEYAEIPKKLQYFTQVLLYKQYVVLGGNDSMKLSPLGAQYLKNSGLVS